MDDSKYYMEEIRLSRDLARSIEQVLHQYGRVIPSSVLICYERLVELYKKEIEEGIS